MTKIIAIAFTVAAALAVPAWAQNPATDHAAHHDATEASSGPMAEGEVRKVDKATRKITLKHGPIPSIDMPAMTMAYPVKDPALLDKAKPGEKVEFRAEMIGGVATVTQLEQAK